MEARGSLEGHGDRFSVLETTPKVFANCSPGFPALGLGAPSNMQNSTGVRDWIGAPFANTLGVIMVFDIANPDRKPWAAIRQRLRRNVDSRLSSASFGLG